MTSRNYFIQSVLWLACLSPITVFALPADFLKEVDVSIAAGPSWYHASNGSVQTFPGETDSDQVSYVTKSTTYRLGVGYHLFAAQLAERKFFNDLLIQLNGYHDSATIKGYMWAAGSPQVPGPESQPFNAPFTASRLMIDLKPSLFTIYHTSLYPITGVGMQWNRISYTETQEAWPVVQASAQTNRNIAYDLGVGISSHLTKNFSASLEYITTRLPHMQASTNSTGTQVMLQAPSFPAHEQSVLLGFSWKF